MKRMIVDTANLLFRASSAHSKYNNASPEDSAGLAMHVALTSLNKYYKKFKPDQLVVTFEGSQNWRKAYTKSEKCVSKRVYKANRVKDPSMEPFFELIRAFEDLARTHTSICCLSHQNLEGDDLFAGFVDMMCTNFPDDEIIGISGDKDFVQLLKYPNFSLINPDNGKPRTLIDVCGVDDANYFIFEKCFRGDTGDNVMSAYPNVRKTRLQKAYKDPFELTNILNETWSFTDKETGETTNFKVGDLFNENKLLMDLTSQPEDIRETIKQAVAEGLANHGKFSFFHFSKFCGKYGLKQIGENAASFAEMFDTSESKFNSIEKKQKKALIEY